MDPLGPKYTRRASSPQDLNDLLGSARCGVNDLLVRKEDFVSLSGDFFALGGWTHIGAARQPSSTETLIRDNREFWRASRFERASAYGRHIGLTININSSTIGTVAVGSDARADGTLAPGRSRQPSGSSR